MTVPYAVRESNGKGEGVFARTDIRKGTVIMRDRKALHIMKTSENITEDDMEFEFRRLSPANQARYLALHQDHKGLYGKKLGIWRANAFGDGHSSTWIYLLISKINHQCVPNSRMRNDTVVAEQDILAGEEIFISYADPEYETMTARQRARRIQRNYGFQCRCIACQPGGFGQLSDMRRQLISMLRSALDGYLPPDYGLLEKTHPTEGWKVQWPPSKIPLPKPIRPVQRVEYSFLLALLREAEGLSRMAVAESYVRAAQRLMDVINTIDPRMQDVLPLEPARVVRAWCARSVEVAKAVSPSDDADLARIQANQNATESFTPLKMSEMVVSFANVL